MADRKMAHLESVDTIGKTGIFIALTLYLIFVEMIK